MSWPLVKLGKLCKVVRGSSPRPKGDPRYYGGDIPRLMVSDVTRDGKYVTPRIDYLTESGAEKSRPMKNGDFVIAVSGQPGQALILAVDACIHDGFAGLRDLDEARVSKDYLFHFMNSAKERFSATAAGAIFKNLTTEQIRELEIPLPPLDEQKRIAAILDKADAIRRKRQQAIKLADDFLRSVFLDMFGDPVTNLKGWEVKKLGDFCRFQGGFAFKSSDYTNDGIPLVKITNVHFENLEWDDVSYLSEKFMVTKSDFSLNDGDLVMAMTRPIIKSLNAVKVVEVKDRDLPCLLNQRVGRFIEYERVVEKEFLKAFIYSDYFKSEVEKLCSAALQPNVSSKQIESIACYTPPRYLQERYSEVVRKAGLISPSMREASNTKLFESLSQKAFSGQLSGAALTEAEQQLEADCPKV